MRRASGSRFFRADCGVALAPRALVAPEHSVQHRAAVAPGHSLGGHGVKAGWHGSLAAAAGGLTPLKLAKEMRKTL